MGKVLLLLIAIDGTHGLCDCAFVVPAPGQAGVNRLAVNSEFICPRSDTLGFSVECNQAVVSFVPLLLLEGGPPTVFGAVSEFVVRPVEGMSKGAFTHILKETFKHAPAFTYVDATTTIAGVRCVSLVVAPIQHTRPGIPRWSACKAMPNIFAASPARRRFPLVQVGGDYCSDIPALAPAGPHRLSAPIGSSIRYNKPLTESFPGEVFEVSPCRDRMCFSHDSLLPKSKCCGEKPDVVTAMPGFVIVSPRPELGQQVAEVMLCL